jgi:predicted nucleotidyltransferase component of viral defense system
MALSRADFFKLAEFHGGTALRILYGLQRFSEDLDFALLQVDEKFNWQKYFAIICDELNMYGYNVELQDRSKADQAVKKAFIKDNSIGKVLLLNNPNVFHSNKKVKIKLEIDTNPPPGANSEIKYLDFPLIFSVRVQSLPSSFAGKLHALLCRKYTKGRDWYDFIWYTTQNSTINFSLLSNALNQMGPWQNQNIIVNQTWLIEQLKRKIESIDWSQTAQDVMQFLKPHEQETLKLWNQGFFLSRVEKIH